MPNYEFLDHTADVKFIANGNTIEEVFLNSAWALKESICGKILVLEKETKFFEINANNIENLLHDFLEEFLFLLDSQDFLFSKITKLELNKEAFTIKAEIIGDKADNYKFTNDVKAITFNEMFIKNENNTWQTQVVLDV